MKQLFARGYFGKPGIMHLHVDGGQQEDLVRGHVQTYGGKLHQIIQAVPGPQRYVLPEVYQGHTPGSSKEEFKFYSTIPVSSINDAITKVSAILPPLVSYHDIVLELERVILRGEGASSSMAWEEVPPIQAITTAEIPYPQASTLPIEIHHGINISKQYYPDPPISLSTLLMLATEIGMCVGGWFLFDKGDAWAYRSNEFTLYEGFREKVQAQNAALHVQLQELGFPYSLWTIAEQVVGLWRT